MNVPDAKDLNPTYENITCTCPWCEKKAIFNRASDLKTFEVIAERTVACPQCDKSFNLHGDAINPAHEMLVFDCYDLMDQKHYMQCILNLAQAYEVFFSLFLRVELLYRPYVADPERDWDHLNVLKEKLYRKVQHQTFVPMRNLFLRQVLTGVPLRTLEDAERAIDSLSDLPPEQELDIDAVADRRLRELIQLLKATNINKLRNCIVHKDVYRPTLAEVELALEEAQKILFPLGKYFGLYNDDVEFYMGQQ